MPNQVESNLVLAAKQHPKCKEANKQVKRQLVNQAISYSVVSKSCLPHLESAGSPKTIFCSIFPQNWFALFAAIALPACCKNPSCQGVVIYPKCSQPGKNQVIHCSSNIPSNRSRLPCKSDGPCLLPSDAIRSGFLCPKRRSGMQRCRILTLKLAGIIICRRLVQPVWKSRLINMNWQWTLSCLLSPGKPADDAAAELPCVWPAFPFRRQRMTSLYEVFTVKLLMEVFIPLPDRLSLQLVSRSLFCQMFHNAASEGKSETLSSA